MRLSNPVSAWREVDRHPKGDASTGSSNIERNAGEEEHRPEKKGWESGENKELVYNAVKNWLGLDIDESDVLDVFDEVEGPALTVDDITTRLNCSPEVAENHLETLVEGGQVEERTSSGVTIWWIREDHPLNRLDQDVVDKLRDYKRENERITETYHRIRGSPPAELIKEIVAEIDLDADALEAAIKEKQKTNRRNRDEIRDFF